jgi:tRNA 2-thiocytidine biosynthesis protein TtcA
MQNPDLKLLLHKIGRAVGDFNLIEEGDRIAVGVSGGKDSSCLLYALNQVRKFSPVKFDLRAIHIAMGWPVGLAPLARFAAGLGVDLIIEETAIGPIVFEHRREPNPCSLCAKMRRGALHNAAVRAGCNKVALAHHQDDAVETLLMSLFFEGRLQTFLPRTYLDRKKLTLIRPLVYAPESLLRETAANLGLPVLPNPCPANGFTRRQEMKELVARLAESIPDVRDKVTIALRNVNFNNIWPQKRHDRRNGPEHVSSPER